MPDTEKHWSGPIPSTCDLCNYSLERARSFIDGATRMGRWAIMCPSCHDNYGRGLGTGRGQHYSHSTGKKIAG